MPDHLLLMSLGPVQDFIAAARTAQDLWYGSWILSDLSRTAARTAHTSGEPIFPAAVDDEHTAAANRILVLIRDKTPESVVAAVREATNSRLQVLSRVAFDRLAKAPLFDRNLAEVHISDLVDFFWAAEPIATDDDYSRAKNVVEERLARRKNTHRWTAVTTIALNRGHRFKSSVDGHRESAVDRTLDVEIKEGKIKTRELWQNYRVKQNEYLCGVSFMKRLGQELDEAALRTSWIPQFHSSSHLAAAGLLARAVADADVRVALLGHTRALPEPVRKWATLRRAANAITMNCPWREDSPPRTATREEWSELASVDAAVFFEGRLAEACTECMEYGAEQSLSTATVQLRKLLDKLDIDEVPPYYAIIMADGDRMGARIHELGANRASALASHRKLSEALVIFARDARTSAERLGGSLIYSGGDDVFAMVPLHAALSYATGLSEAFAQTVGDPFPELPLPTLSAGIAIVHHMDPLVDARRLAEDAMRASKKSRNALTIALSMRSGQDVLTTGSWNQLPIHIRTLATWLDQELLPDSLGYALEEVVVLSGSHWTRAARPLVERAVSRRRSAEGSDEITGEVTDYIAECLDRDTALSVAVKRLTGELRVARIFQRAFRVAWGAPQSPAVAASGIDT